MADPEAREALATALRKSILRRGDDHKATWIPHETRTLVTDTGAEERLRAALERLPRFFESYALHGDGSCLREHHTGEWVRYSDLRAALSGGSVDEEGG